MPLQFHPEDRGENLNPVYLREDAATFTPKPSNSLGTVEVWGTHDYDPSFDAFAGSMRMMKTQFLYNQTKSIKETPEQQFVTTLMNRKKSLIKSQSAARKHLLDCDFVLRVSLQRWPDKDKGEFGYHEITPSVWRRVVVSGGLNLRSLHDRVLGPAMG